MISAEQRTEASEYMKRKRERQAREAHSKREAERESAAKKGQRLSELRAFCERQAAHFKKAAAEKALARAADSCAAAGRDAHWQVPRAAQHRLRGAAARVRLLAPTQR